MPAKGKRKLSPKQKAKMVVGKIIGKSSREVGEDLGVHPDVVRRYWGGHESLNLQLKRENAPLIREYYREGLTFGLRVIRRRNVARVKPDPQLDRLALVAAKLGLDYATAGDPPLERVVPPPPPPPEGQTIRVTLEELLISYRRATFETARQNPEAKTQKGD